MTQEEDWKARALEAERKLKEVQAWSTLPNSVIKREVEQLWQQAEGHAVSHYNGDRRHGHIMEDTDFEPVPVMVRRRFFKSVIERIVNGDLPIPPLL